MKFGSYAFLISLALLLCAHLEAQSVPDYPNESGVRQTLLDLEEKMRQIENMQTGFIQKKKLSSFKNEIVLRGSIHMQKPDRFAWHTESPLRYSMVFQDGKIHQWNEDSGRVEVRTLSDEPVLKLVMEQMQTWFSGTYAALLGQYDIEILSEDPLVLRFVPLENAFSAGMIKELNIRFHSDRSYLEAIRIEEETGDVSELNFTDTVLNAEMDPAVWKAGNRAA